tara:strand:- start:47 stop:1138 length:1092 start_codon:yes stop_codon:yes gene_type:complete
MTIWSIPLRGIRGKKPRDYLSEQIDKLFNKKSRPHWKKEYVHDSLPIIDGIAIEEVEIPYHKGISIIRYEYKGEDLSSKLSQNDNFRHMIPHLGTIFSEIVIDDSFWKYPYMPDYPNHNDFEKYQTVIMQSACLITALRLIDYNRCIAPFLLKNSTLNGLGSCKEKTAEVLLNHPFQIPMAVFKPGRSKARLSSKEMEWVGKAMITMNHLFYEEQNDFTTTLEAMSYYYADLPPRPKMMMIWSAIEDLLRPKGSIRFGVRKRFAMILGKTDTEMKKIHDLVDDLYYKRNSATHGRRFTWSHGIEDMAKNENAQNDMNALLESYQLLCDLFFQIIDRGRRYTDEELLQMDDEYEVRFPSKQSEK